MRQITNALLWLVLLPMVGAVEVLRAVPRIFGRLGVKGSLMLVTLVALWRMNSLSPVRPITAAIDGVLGPSVVPWLVLAAAAIVFSRGVRSPLRRRLFRRLRRSG